jgi:predicted enzyme related to lactoylglutathione lyase
VTNPDEAMRLCAERGGKIRIPPKNLSGHDRYCVIEDPAGALAALCEAKA